MRTNNKELNVAGRILSLIKTVTAPLAPIWYLYQFGTSFVLCLLCIRTLRRWCPRLLESRRSCWLPEGCLRQHQTGPHFLLFQRSFESPLGRWWSGPGECFGVLSSINSSHSCGLLWGRSSLLLYERTDGRKWKIWCKSSEDSVGDGAVGHHCWSDMLALTISECLKSISYKIGVYLMSADGRIRRMILQSLESRIHSNCSNK